MWDRHASPMHPMPRLHASGVRPHAHINAISCTPHAPHAMPCPCHVPPCIAYAGTCPLHVPPMHPSCFLHGRPCTLHGFPCPHHALLYLPKPPMHSLLQSHASFMIFKCSPTCPPMLSHARVMLPSCPPYTLYAFPWPPPCTFHAPLASLMRTHGRFMLPHALTMPLSRIWILMAVNIYEYDSS